MTKFVITGPIKSKLERFLKVGRRPELLPTYLHFIEVKYQLSPVVCPVQKTVYRSEAEAIEKMEAEGKIWRETEIKVRFDQSSVNDETTKIYICPFSGKVFGNNTHPNPQDAIYDWVSTCSENTERLDGIRVKRFFVSEDFEVIKNYIKERKAPITKIVFSSAVNNKLYNAKKTVMDDFRKNYLKPLNLIEVQNQNRFEIESEFLAFLQEHLTEENIMSFVEAAAVVPELSQHVERWLEASEEEEIEVLIEEEAEFDDEAEEAEFDDEAEEADSEEPVSEEDSEVELR